MAANSAKWRASSYKAALPADSLLRFLGPRYWPAWLLVAWLRMVSLLPWRFAIKIHKGIGSVLWLLMKKRRHIVERNVELAFPRMGRPEIQVLTRQHFQNLAACVAETAFAWFGRVDDSLTHFEIEGVEHVTSALASGRGVILYTGHFTSLEICAPILKASFPLVGFMFHRMRNGLLNAFQRRGRRYAGHLSFPSDNARAMIEALKKKAVVWYAPDQCYSTKGSVAIKHFGKSANVSLATSRLARMSGAAIVPFGYYRRSDDSGYVLRFEPPIEQSGTDEECTAHLLATLEDLITDHPEQYAWTPNRLRNSGINAGNHKTGSRNQRQDPEAPSKRSLPSATGRLILALLGVALFITLVDNTSFFGSVWQATRSGDHRWAIMLTMALLVQTSLILVLCMAVGIRLFKGVAAALLVIAATVGFFMSNYGILIDPSMIRNVVETDVREASPLITASALTHIIGFGVAPALIVLLLPLRRVGWKRDIALRLGTGIASIALLVATIYVNYGPVTFFGHQHHELRMQLNPVYALYALASYLTRANDKPPADRLPLDAQRRIESPRNGKHLLFVLIMGETARADRFALNGYRRDTNPYTREDDIVNFPHVTSCGTSTADSLPCIFSSLNRADFSHAKFAERESLFQTLDRLGVDTVWLDNSTGCKYICDTEDLIALAGETDDALCRENVCVDEILLRDFGELISDSTQDHFIVLHQRGSHGPAYFTDTPEWAKVYLPECDLPSLQNCSPESINNAYDNTIRYTDYFLAQVIELLQKESNRYETAMLYVSDHGESLGEKGLYLHGLPYSLAPSEQTDVPMIFWGSPGFYERQSIDSNCLKAASAEPTSHAAIFHTILSLFDIRSPDYLERWDLFADCHEIPIDLHERVATSG